MRRIESLSEFVRNVEGKKASLGVSEDSYARARNRGDRRTPEKRAILAAMQERARQAGVEPIPANF
jgi:hypothetical protein